MVEQIDENDSPKIFTMDVLNYTQTQRAEGIAIFSSSFLTFDVASSSVMRTH